MGYTGDGKTLNGVDRLLKQFAHLLMPEIEFSTRLNIELDCT